MSCSSEISQSASSSLSWLSDSSKDIGRLVCAVAAEASRLLSKLHSLLWAVVPLLNLVKSSIPVGESGSGPQSSGWEGAAALLVSFAPLSALVAAQQ